MKTTATFKIPKYVKRRMATIVDSNARHQYKNMMIQGILHGNITIAPKEKKGKNKSMVEVTD